MKHLLSLCFTDAPGKTITCAVNGFCMTLNEGVITAEAGLCAVIPCLFTPGYGFTPKHIVWYKCDAQKQRCSDSDMIFHTNKNNPKVQSGFRGRVSLLEPDVNQKNCSIIINDLTESDSGSYQLRVHGFQDGFTFTPRATISVKDLIQKPTLMISPLIIGQQTTLTCTAPGLCSGSVPKITWTWRGEGERDSHITGNVTAVKNESVTSVAQRYSSTLTFDPSAEHHGTTVTCKVSFRNNITAEETVTLNVNCYGFTPKHIVWSKCYAWKQRCSDSDMIFHTSKNNPKVQSGFRGRVSLLEPDVNQKNCSIIINDLTESDSGSYQLRVSGFQDGFSFTPRATISVKDLMQKPTLMTDTQSLTEGKQTTLTCTAPGLCSGSIPQITWTWRGEGENDSYITGNVTTVRNESVTSVAQRYSSTLTFDPSAEHHGSNVTCKVSFANNITAEETVTLTVNYVKEVKITGNTSMKEGETLNLTCSVESFPPSLVAWTKFSDKHMQNGTKNKLQNDTFTDLQNDTEIYPPEEKTGMVTYSITNVTAEDSGRYICTAKYLNNTLMEKVDVTVILFPKILKDSGCKVQSEVRTCVCMSQGFPLPTIKWPLLEKHTEYSIITSVSNHTVNSSITLHVKNSSSATVECVSSNEMGK
ncbi:Sialic acid-binding Ig-like lectin 5 [Nibea albiflora]|uniref:Sialic acid-binding Ig-like lectin 5 n=1 Tax=Nibea albiflora TaxID=240163 RepID=A0ACB7F6T8_NIBAL|nr:Sialic acid-binding Ig-like lectin 5 [Nibea albiflora]